MKVVYVAGPYRAEGWNGVWENIMRAREVSRQLWLKGWAVICPHANTIFMDGPDIEANQFIEGDLEILARSDALCVIDGWLQSDGAQQEHQRAMELQMPIYYGADSVPDLSGK